MHLVDARVIASEYALLATYIQQTIVGSTTSLENFAHVTFFVARRLTTL